MAGTNEVLDTTIEADSIKLATTRLNKSLEFFMAEPKQHLQTYGMIIFQMNLFVSEKQFNTLLKLKLKNIAIW